MNLEHMKTGKEENRLKLTYVFVRKEGFYEVELSGDAEAIRSAAINPGTLKIMRPDGAVVWEAGRHE